MCLAIPGKLIEIFDRDGIAMGKIDFNGTINEACLEYVPDVTIGEYLIVHAGFALNRIDEVEAKKTLALWDEMTEKAAEEGLDVFGMPLNKQDKKAD